METLGDRLFGNSAVAPLHPRFRGEAQRSLCLQDSAPSRLPARSARAHGRRSASRRPPPRRTFGRLSTAATFWSTAASGPITRHCSPSSRRLTCFDIGRDQIDVFSLGGGDDPFIVSRAQIMKGGIWHWKKIILPRCGCNRSRPPTKPASPRAACGYAHRAALFTPPIRMDDWRRSVQELLPAVERALFTAWSAGGRHFPTLACSRFIPSPDLASAK